MRLKFFDSEEARQEDHEARLVPKVIWDAYFDCTLTEIERAVLQSAPNDPISIDFKSPQVQSLSETRKRSL